MDLIREAAPFDLSFYRHFVRNGFEAPASTEPLRRQAQSPRFYLRTVDDNGQAISETTLATVTRNITPDLIGAFSGGRLTLAGVERGTDTREGEPGWITIRWLATRPEANICGRAWVGGAVIELYDVPVCGCPGTGGTYPRLVKHEVGHTMGFWHTDDDDDVMYGKGVNDCDNDPSARERHHAAIAYARPIGSRDLDVDPGFSASRVRPVMVID